MSYQEPGNIHTTGEERVGTRDVSWRPNTTALQRNQLIQSLLYFDFFSSIFTSINQSCFCIQYFYFRVLHALYMCDFQSGTFSNSD
jgi:hypothetical protein